MTDLTTTHWCEHAWLGDPTAGPHAGVALTIADDRIVDVQTGVPRPPAGAERLDGLTVPGFANAHSHAFHRAPCGVAPMPGWGRSGPGASRCTSWQPRSIRIASTP